MIPQWITTLLNAIGAQPTQQNVSFLEQWQSNEGSGVANANNPLAITWYSGWGPSGASGNYNSLGVLEFPDLQTGINATITYIEHGYSNVIAALKSGNPYTYYAGNPAAVANNTPSWSYFPSLLHQTSDSSSGGSSIVPGAPQGNCPATGSLGCAIRADCPNCYKPATDAIGNAISKNLPIAQMFSTSIVFVGAIGLLLIGGIWLAMGNDTTRQLVYTASKRTAAAVVG